MKLTDQENGLLNPIGVNCLRSFQNIGRVVWGARTLAGSDVLSDDYKYVSVRRLALFIEESLFRGTQWVVFEGNDEPLWAQIRLSVGSFMQRLFRQGAFQGRAPRRPISSSATHRRPRRTTSIAASSTSSSASRRCSRPNSSSFRSSRSAARPKGGRTNMPQFTTNADRFDPYKTYKFRLRLPDGDYVAGVSKCSALKRSTEVVNHREGGDPRPAASRRARPNMRQSRWSAGLPIPSSSSNGPIRCGTMGRASGRRCRSRISART